MTDPTPDLESIRKRLEAATPGPCAYMGDDQAFMREVRTCDAFSLICTMDRDGPDPDADGAFLAAAHDDVVVLLAEVGRLTIERDDYASQADAERARWRPIAERAERAEAALATAKDEERAAVVAWLRGEAHFTDVGPLDTFADAYADGIESNRHREKA